ncbi:triple tyrosine motif-containing protein [Verrucomicrobiota bacterium sgz303538]
MAGLCLPSMAFAAKVSLKSVEASFSERPETLRQVIDGKDSGQTGWSVFPRVEEAHALIVRTAEPVRAQAFDLTFCFMSGQPGRYFGDFALSYTTDDNPSFGSTWIPLIPQGFAATGTTLEQAQNGHLSTRRTDSMIGDAIFQVRASAPHQAVTGFRLEVFPFRRPDADGLRVSWNEYRDFCLTEFRIAAVQTPTTNIALGAPAKASHPLWAGTSATLLTDGLPGSFNHPAVSGLGRDFFFEVDLGAVRQIDHIALRGRADGYGLDRMSRIFVQLYDEAPDSGAKPVWEALDRADCSHPEAGEVDVLRAAEGRGLCQGRYLRLSSDNPVALSPQIAEVEVYETLTPRPTSIKADGNILPLEDTVQVPPGTKVLTVLFHIPRSGLPERLPIRWRLRGMHEDWQVTRDFSAEVSQLPPGTYRLEAQIGHTDGTWDSSLLSLPVTISAVFWKTPGFNWGLSAVGLLMSLAVTRRVIRQRQERQLAVLRLQSALAEERSRIARDMHDEVGARLSQLALMQDLLIRQHAMPDAAQQSLRDLARNTRHAVDALDEVVWAVNPLHDTLSAVAGYLAHVATSYLTPLNISFRMDVPFEWPDIEVRAPIRHQLTLAFREALQNIAKHADASAVTLTMRYEPPHLLTRLADNGRGLPQTPEGVGKDGLINMETRLTKIGGDCTVRRRPEGGTEVKMRAPITSHSC